MIYDIYFQIARLSIFFKYGKIDQFLLQTKALMAGLISAELLLTMAKLRYKLVHR